ncbi:thyrotropin-releasing hormone receptor-like [Elysia marginata]|uniref:Thyrotropin-releasing hormone receptor-like n=1 Tax=Elysia marginata TaxID=1093978 RepID=A0AAV4JEF0_9GAST|nr:thyrotropin-releasing hormone receptor-like [Elysia marginata]
MLFAVSFFFIILNGPSHIIRMKMAVLDLLGRNQMYTPSVEEKLQVIFQIMYYSSFAVNLVIYLIFGDNFRKQFRETYLSPFLRLCGKTRQSGRGCGACSEMTAMSTVRMEEMEARPDEQAALLDAVAPSQRVSEIPSPNDDDEASNNDQKEVNGCLAAAPSENGHKDPQTYIYGTDVYQGEDYSGLISSNV